MKSKNIIKVCSLILWAIACIYTSPCEAQRWRKVLDFPPRSGVKDGVILANGDIISLISSDSMILVALDQQGAVKWRRNMGKGIGLVLESIDDHLLVGGKSGLGFSDMAVLVKLTQDGSLVWQKAYQQGFISAVAKNGSGYWLGGNIDSPGSSSNSVLYKVDSNGLLQWMIEYDVYSNSGVTEILDFGAALYLVLHASTVGVGFEGTVLIKAKASDGQMIWRHNKALGYYTEYPDYHDFLRPIDVSINAANEIVIAAPVNSSNGLIYSYSPDGEIINEVQLDLTLPHAMQILQNGDYLIAGILEGTSEGSNAVVERRSPAGSVVWQRTIGQGSFFAMAMYGDTIIVSGTDQDFRSQSTYRPYIVKMTSDGRVFDGAIHFELFEDLNENCVTDISDQPLKDIILRLDNRFFSSGPSGTIMMDVDTGIYDYAVDLPPYLELCAPQQSVYVQHPGEVVSRTILINRKQCTELSVGMTYTEFIRGETGRFYVQYNNNGSVQVQDVLIHISLDDRLQLESVSSDYVTTVDGIQITIPVLPPNFSDRVRIDVRIDEQLVLFSTICAEASITPRSSCDLDAHLWNGSELEMKTTCENHKAVFRMKNVGSDMSEDVPYELFADGFNFETGTIQLDAGQEQVFNIASGGSTISMRSRQVAGYPFDAVIGASVEGCGILPGQTGSLGMVRMFDPASPTPWVSRACIEVRDQYSADRVFEIARGLGRYHIIDSTQGRCEFALMYKNEAGVTVDKLELFVKPGWQFDPLSFRERASSHTFAHELFGTGVIRLVSENMALLPGDQMQYRFAIDLMPSGPEQDFLTVNVAGAANESIPVNLHQGFYNRNVLGNVSQVSPFVSIENGRIIGRGHTFEFHRTLHVQENGTVLYTGTTHESGIDSRALVLATRSDNTVLWEHTYAFKEGGVLFRKIIPAGEGRLLMIGSIDDNQIAGNFINDAYACMLMLDEHGHELWRRIWKPGTGAAVGGSLNNGHFYAEDKILLLGFRYTPNGARQFLMETDINGDIHWIRDFILGTDTWGYPVTLINDIPMKVSSAGNIFIVGSDYGYEQFIVKLGEDANILLQSKYTDNSSMEAKYFKDFVILDNEEILLIGDGYSYDSEYNFTSFGIMVKLDADFKFMAETKILDQFAYIELNAATIQDSMVFAAGAIRVDSASGTDAVLIRSDLAGAHAQIVRIADFGARDYAYTIDVGKDGRVFGGVQTQTIDNFYNLQMGFFWATDTVTATYTLSDPTDHIQIFPNPSRDIINIVSQKHFIKTNAYAMNGTLMRLTHEGDKAYSVRELPPGMYVLVVYTSDNTRYLAKFIKAE